MLLRAATTAAAAVAAAAAGARHCWRHGGGTGARYVATATEAGAAGAVGEEEARVEVPLRSVNVVVAQCLEQLGYRGRSVRTIRDCLVHAEMRGSSQGITKLVVGAIPRRQRSKNATGGDGKGEMHIVHETAVSARIDGRQHLGICLMDRMVETAMRKAADSGIAVVVGFNTSSTTGALQHWAARIAEGPQGKIGIVCCQSPELVAPAGTYQAIFGTNPIAISMPTSEDASVPPLVLDMATSSAAYFSLVDALIAGEEIPGDIAYDKEGHSTTDPGKALEGALRTFGGYKGSHLALMVELLTGALAGGAMECKTAAKNWGNFVLVLDPEILGCSRGEFRERANQMLERVRAAAPMPDDPHGRGPQLPGARGDRTEQAVRSAESISLNPAVWQALQVLAIKGPDDPKATILPSLEKLG